MRHAFVTISALTAMAGVAVAQTSSQSDKAQGSYSPSAKQGSSAGGSEQTTRPDQQSQAQQKQQGQQNQQPKAGPSSDSQAGVRAVHQTGALAVTFYKVQPADMRASKLIGTDVYNRNNENIGEVEDLIIDNGKNLKALVVSVGGFLGIGDRNIAVDPRSIVLTRQSDAAAPRIVINTTKDDVKGAPEVKFSDMEGGKGTASSNTGATTGANINRSDKANNNPTDKTTTK